MERNVNINIGLDGKKFVLINDVRFALPVYNDGGIVER